MKVMNIIHDSVVDGEGLRTVVFFAGCPHRCVGCHNPKSWNICNGTEMTVEEIVKEIASNPLTDVTFSGGDPFFQAITDPTRREVIRLLSDKELPISKIT
ncbi:4Fe-4S cluster-binding domain-containing protein, partial [Bacillus sp. HC-Mk]